MLSILSWACSNWVTIVVLLTSVIGSASLICKTFAPLTKTTKDDWVSTWLIKLYNFLNSLALNPKPDLKSALKVLNDNAVELKLVKEGVAQNIYSTGQKIITLPKV